MILSGDAGTFNADARDSFIAQLAARLDGVGASDIQVTVADAARLRRRLSTFAVDVRIVVSGSAVANAAASAVGDATSSKFLNEIGLTVVRIETATVAASAIEAPSSTAPSAPIDAETGEALNVTESNGTIGAVSAGVIVGVLLVLAIVCYVVWQRRRKQASTSKARAPRASETDIFTNARESTTQNYCSATPTISVQSESKPLIDIGIDTVQNAASPLRGIEIEFPPEPQNVDAGEGGPPKQGADFEHGAESELSVGVKVEQSTESRATTEECAATEIGGATEQGAEEGAATLPVAQTDPEMQGAEAELGDDASEVEQSTAVEHSGQVAESAETEHSAASELSDASELTAEMELITDTNPGAGIEPNDAVVPAEQGDAPAPTEPGDAVLPTERGDAAVAVAVEAPLPAVSAPPPAAAPAEEPAPAAADRKSVV